MAAVLCSCACENERVSHLPLVISSKIGASSVLSTVPAAMANEIRTAVASGDLPRSALFSGRMAALTEIDCSDFNRTAFPKC